MIVDFSNLKKWILKPYYFAFKEINKRYIIATGGRGSGKSFSLIGVQAVYKSFIINGNILVAQKTYSAIKDATFSNIVDKIEGMGLSQYFKINRSPFEITNNLNGNKILFRGIDKPEKLKSIEKVRLVLLEEADQFSQRDFEILDLSIRGKDNINIFCLFNPTNPFTFLKTEFIDKNRDDTLLVHTTYLDNPFLGTSFYREMERLKKDNFERYKMDGLGEFGNVEGLVFSNFEIKDFDYSQFNLYYGLDWGWTHPLFLLKVAISERNKEIYVCEEFAGSKIDNTTLKNHILKNNYGKIYCDSAEPKSIEYLKKNGINAVGVNKSISTVVEQIRILQEYKIIIHSSCRIFIKQAYLYKYPENKTSDEPVKLNDDGYDSLRYALSDFLAPKQKTSFGGKRL